MDDAVAVNKANVPEITLSTATSEQQITENEHSFPENNSTMSQSSGTTSVPPFVSRSPPGESESVTSNLGRNPPRKDADRKDHDRHSLKSTHMPVMRKSHFVGGTNPFISKQVPLTQPYLQVSRDNTTDCVLRSSEKFSSYDLEQCVEIKLDFSLKSQSLSKDVPNSTKCKLDAGDELRPPHNIKPAGDELRPPHNIKPAGDELRPPHNIKPAGDELRLPHNIKPAGDELRPPHNIKPAYSDLEPHSQKSDLAPVPDRHHLKLKLNTNSDVSEGIGNIKGKNFYHYNIPSTQRPAFEMSELGLKLRSSIQSHFLFNELGLWSHRRSEDTNQDPSRSIRTIDAILKHHGISDNTADTNSKEDNADVNEEQAYCQAENSNISQNNETVSSYSETIASGKKDGFASVNSSEALNMSLTSTHASLANDNKMSPLTNVEDKEILATSEVASKTNLSQNNETIKYGKTESEALRKYGSSVDYYTSATSGGRQSHPQKNNYGRYDYGKVTPFSGDTSSGSTLTHQTPMGTTNYESNLATTLKIKSEGSQVDMTTPKSSTLMGPGYTYKNVTSESLEHSIFSERQRLRRLNNLITATSMSAPKIPMIKSPTTKFMSPQHDLQKYSAMKQVDKVLSTPTFRSSSPAPKLTNIRSWAGSGRPDSQMHLHKSSNSTGQWMQGVQHINRYRSSMDFQSPYRPFNSARHYNTQYNNSTYQSQVIDAFRNQANINRNHLKLGSTNKQDFDLKNTKNCISCLSKQSSYSNSKSPISYTSSLPIYDNSRSYTASNLKPNYQTQTMTGKSNGNTNINDSKSVSCINTSLKFAKDLDKRFPNPLAVKGTNISLKYSAYSPYTPIHAMKNETFHNLAKQLFHNKKPPNTVKANFSRTESPERYLVSKQQRGSHLSSQLQGRPPLPSAKECDKRKSSPLEKRNPEQRQ